MCTLFYIYLYLSKTCVILNLLSVLSEHFSFNYFIHNMSLQLNDAYNICIMGRMPCIANKPIVIVIVIVIEENDLI